MTMKLSGFADEIDPQIDKQIEVCGKLGLKYIEMRGVDGVNVLEIDDAKVGEVREKLKAAGIGVSAIGSPIGKSNLSEPEELELKRVDRAIELCNAFDCNYVRVFSYYLPEGTSREQGQSEVIRRLTALADKAAAAGAILLHENEKGIFGESDKDCRILHDNIQSSAFRMTFDPANFIQAGTVPFPDAYQLLKDAIEYIHLKDALKDGGKVTPVGKGDGGVKDLLSALRDSGYSGFISLEPHLSSEGQFGGFSGEQLFGEAHKALVGLLTELDIEYV
jgi:3-dehydroshikimate dehydratase